MEFVHDLRREPKDELLKPLKNLPDILLIAASISGTVAFASADLVQLS